MLLSCGLFYMPDALQTYGDVIGGDITAITKVTFSACALHEQLH